MKTTYEANGWFADLEQDKFEEGCVGGGFLKSGKDVFRGDTLQECVTKCREFVGADPDCLDIDPDDPSRLNIQATETDDGYAADKHDIEAWKKGEKRLWLAHYSFTIRKVTREKVKIERSAFPC